MPRPAIAGTLPGPGSVCAAFAAAATIDTARSTWGQTRQAAARRCGGPHLQALYSGGGQGPDPQQELWQLHQAQVHATATSTQDAHFAAGTDLAPELADAEQASPRVTGTACGGHGWSAPLAAYRVECLLSAVPVRGWLVNDIATEPPTFPAAPSAGGSR